MDSLHFSVWTFNHQKALSVQLLTKCIFMGNLEKRQKPDAILIGQSDQIRTLDRFIKNEKGLAY